MGEHALQEFNSANFQTRVIAAILPGEF